MNGKIQDISGVVWCDFSFDIQNEYMTVGDNHA